jgi:site-specific recombinase XerD
LPTVDAEAWSPYSQPLSAREVNRRLKMHAARAGLESRDIHVHTLRHSAAMLMDEAGADLAEIMKFLNHESLATTQRYIHKMRGQRNVHAAKMAELLNL